MLLATAVVMRTTSLTIYPLSTPAITPVRGPPRVPFAGLCGEVFIISRSVFSAPQAAPDVGHLPVPSAGLRNARQYKGAPVTAETYERSAALSEHREIRRMARSILEFRACFRRRCVHRAGGVTDGVLSGELAVYLRIWEFWSV